MYSHTKSKTIDKRSLSRMNNIQKLSYLVYLQFRSYTSVKFLTLSIVFSVCKITTKTKHAKFLGFAIYVEAVLCLLPHSLYDCTFNYA